MLSKIDGIPLCRQLRAIEAGKLDAVKTEFAKFEDSWKTLEDEVKSKSDDPYRRDFLSPGNLSDA